MEHTGGFGPLKATLGIISTVYTNYEVRLRSLLTIIPWLTHLQETVAIRNKIDDLFSRMAVLEPLFTALPSDVAEQRRRSGLIRYALIPPSRPGAESPLASSKA